MSETALLSGHEEFRDGPRFFRHFQGAMRQDDLRAKKVLDIGCGYGGRTIYYAKVCGAASVAGIEIDERVVDRCKLLAADLNASNVHFSRGFAEDLPFADASFDAVVSFDVLEHCIDPPKAVAEMTRVLRPGGKAWNVFPTYRGARSSHLDYITRVPVLHRVFHPDSLVRVVNQFLSEPEQELGPSIQPEPGWTALGWYTLPHMNGLTLKQARRIFASSKELRCDRIILTPLVDPQLSLAAMGNAARSKSVGMIAFAVARGLGLLQRFVPLPELLIQNIAVCSTKRLRLSS